MKGDTLYGTDGLMALWQTNFSNSGRGGAGKNMFSGLGGASLCFTSKSGTNWPDYFFMWLWEMWRVNHYKLGEKVKRYPSCWSREFFTKNLLQPKLCCKSFMNIVSLNFDHHSNKIYDSKASQMITFFFILCEVWEVLKLWEINEAQQGGKGFLGDASGKEPTC